MSNAQVDPRQLQWIIRFVQNARARMIIVRMEPDEPNHQKRTYECPECQLVESLIVKHR
jgi:hypothetical protein